jgi:hypothetical protein
MSANAMVRQETSNGDLWEKAVDKELQRAKSKYRRLISRQLVGLFLMVYVKTQYEKLINDFRHEAIGVGAMVCS